MTLQDIKTEISAEFAEKFWQHKKYDALTSSQYANISSFLLHSIDKSIQRFREETAVKKMGYFLPKDYEDGKALPERIGAASFNEALRLKSEREDNFIKG